ncbi:type II toxin-antitoxin system HipA family toxin [Cupriavidus basilensis]|uniref:type II toxin-antitoxin system HipA family toxin n=1 Tax=Cupriavidus basilensis TaxID=68895 RepID=UPI00157BAF2B|nr:type II toxin-antitoxin system HipA family toxin [Cupriavidus basilensis]NUA29559.1 type II toxin-antitoxin system HipA family toxin [Cupriavidus basilensis]
MGRRSHARALSVWANGERVGTWRIPTRGDMELQYDPGWLASPAGRPLSLSLPFGVDTSPLKGDRVRNYFDNLLPDSDAIRKRLATRFKAATTEAFDLLEAIGRDCVGAVQLLGENEQPAGHDRIEGTPQSDSDIEKLLRQTVSPTGMGAQDDDDDLRISLAGAQEKTALLWHGNQWMKPHGATPTTHILKLPLGLVGNKRADLSTSVENEWLCLTILAAYGLPVAHSEIKTFASQKVLSVQRFDRQMHSSGGWILRLPQEDFCQALGVAPHLKYEADGGPGMRDIAQILRQSTHADEDLEIFLTTQILFWMLAAPDGHAKNFSIRLLPGGRYRMTPLYDVMSIWPVVGFGANQWSWHKAKLAMAVAGKNRHYLFKDVQRRHFNAMAPKCFHGPDAEGIVQRLIAQTPAVIATVSAALPEGFPQKVAHSILQGLEASARQLDRMPPG